VRGAKEKLKAIALKDSVFQYRERKKMSREEGP
jgi:hypothetical protein